MRAAHLLIGYIELLRAVLAAIFGCGLVVADANFVASRDPAGSSRSTMGAAKLAAWLSELLRRALHQVGHTRLRLCTWAGARS